MPKPIVWLVTAPLAFAAAISGHAVMNAVFGAPVGPEHELFVVGGAGSELVPLVAAVVFALLVVALCMRIIGPAGAASSRLSALPFACVTPLVFVVQEHLETALHSGSVLGTALEPTFVAGLALQLPFALAAYLIARFLLGLADDVRRVLVEPDFFGIWPPLDDRAEGRVVGWMSGDRDTGMHPGRAPPVIALGLA